MPSFAQSVLDSLTSQKQTEHETVLCMRVGDVMSGMWCVFVRREREREASSRGYRPGEVLVSTSFYRYQAMKAVSPCLPPRATPMGPTRWLKV
jgi:hypothetical protein